MVKGTGHQQIEFFENNYEKILNQAQEYQDSPYMSYDDFENLSFDKPYFSFIINRLEEIGAVKKTVNTKSEFLVAEMDDDNNYVYYDDRAWDRARAIVERNLPRLKEEESGKGREGDISPGKSSGN